MASILDTLPSAEELQAADSVKLDAVSEELAKLIGEKEPYTDEQKAKIVAVADARDWKWFARVASFLPSSLSDAVWEKLGDSPKLLDVERAMAYRDKLAVDNPTADPTVLWELDIPADFTVPA